MAIIRRGTGSPSSWDYVTLDKILKWREEKQRFIPKKRIPDKESFYSEPDCAVESPKKISMIARVTPSIKAKLIEYIDAREWHELHEGNQMPASAPIDAIWIETLNFDYKRVEHADNYWLASIGLICSACVSGSADPDDYIKCEKFEEDWGYDDRGFCWLFGEDWWYLPMPAMCSLFSESW